MALRHNQRPILLDSGTLSQNSAWQTTYHASGWSRLWKGVTFWPFGLTRRNRSHSRGDDSLIEVNRNN